MTKRRLKIMRRAYSRPSIKVTSRTVSRSGNIAGTVLFNKVGIILKDATTRWWRITPVWRYKGRPDTFRTDFVFGNHLKDQNSGLNLVKLHQIVRKHNNRQGKLWLLFFEIPWEKKDDYWSILCCIIGSIAWRNREETVTFEEKNYFSWCQCTISHIEHCNGKKTWIGFRIVSASTGFSRPGPQRLLSLFKPQKMAVW